MLARFRECATSRTARVSHQTYPFADQLDEPQWLADPTVANANKQDVRHTCGCAASSTVPQIRRAVSQRAPAQQPTKSLGRKGRTIHAPVARVEHHFSFKRRQPAVANLPMRPSPTGSHLDQGSAWPDLGSGSGHEPRGDIGGPQLRLVAVLPWWALLIIGIDILVIWALANYHRQLAPQGTRAPAP